MYHKGLWVSLKKFKINPIIKVLIVSDFLVWSAYNLVAPVFAIYISDQINNSKLEVIGIAAALYFIFKAIFEVPVGIYIDRSKSEKDDLYTAVIGTILTGFVYFSYIFITEVWQLYLAQSILGIAAALAFPGWYSIFTRHIDKEKQAFEWSLYDVLIGIGIAAASALGAFIAEIFGFNILFFVLFILTILGAWLLIIIKNRIYLR